jgi:hypothetical protein
MVLVRGTRSRPSAGDPAIDRFARRGGVASVRTSAKSCGGVVNSADQQWSFHGFTVCDGGDPEGHVIQFREPNNHDV